ncbi:hypothetical protein JKP88DRAFT_176048, partial [Tribonema minus]
MLVGGVLVSYVKQLVDGLYVYNLSTTSTDNIVRLLPSSSVAGAVDFWLAATATELLNGNQSSTAVAVTGYVYTVAFSQTSVTVNETGPTSQLVTVQLLARPTADVVLNLTAASSRVDIAPAYFSFTRASWNIAQTFTVMAIDTSYDEGTSYADIITSTLTTSDAALNGAQTPNITVTIIDNDVAGVTLSAPTAITCTVDMYGNSTLKGTYSVSLATKPLAAVQVSIGGLSSDSVASPLAAFFGASNYSTPVTISVSAKATAKISAVALVRTETVTHVVTSTDSYYNKLAAPSVTASV